MRMNENRNPPKPNNANHRANSNPPTISIEQFLNLVQLKTATIIEVDPVPGKDRLYQLKIEVGDETRTIVAGIKGLYSPEELMGKTIVIVSNLEPKKLGGIESQGMLLAAQDNEGKFSLVVCERPVKSGTIIR